MAATSTSDAPSDGPVLNLINKRIRALRKKLTRIHQMEESLSLGKSLNPEQQETLRSKSAVLALIDELEKLRSPLSAAVAEEISLSQAASDVTAGNDDAVLEDLLNLIYFGSLFDVMPQSEFTSTMLTRTHERGCCLTYDCVTDDAADDLLGEKDLDSIAALKGRVISRPLSSSLSHKNAMQRCIEQAKLWLAKSDQPLDQETNVTYAGLREKLRKIMSSDYFTTTPEMRGSAEMAAAASVASFGSFQVPLHGSVIPVSVPAQAEESIEQYQQEEEDEEEDVNLQDYEIAGEHQSVPVEELQNANLEVENATEETSFQVEKEIAQAEAEVQQPRDVDSKEQPQYANRRPYQNYRGGGGRGGRRGYSNGRGSRGSGRGGVYQNERGQYYDQGSNYYPRNNYRGRGGRGGGNSYYNNSYGAQGAHAQSNVEPAS